MWVHSEHRLLLWLSVWWWRTWVQNLWRLSLGWQTQVSFLNLKCKFLALLIKSKCFYSTYVTISSEVLADIWKIRSLSWTPPRLVYCYSTGHIMVLVLSVLLTCCVMLDQLLCYPGLGRWDNWRKGLVQTLTVFSSETSEFPLSCMCFHEILTFNVPVYLTTI